MHTLALAAVAHLAPDHGGVADLLDGHIPLDMPQLIQQHTRPVAAEGHLDMTGRQA